MLILSSAIQNVGVQLLITTSCEACLVLRGSLPCLSPHLPVFQVLFISSCVVGCLGGGFRSSRAWGFSTLTFLPAKPNLACSVAYPSRRMSVAELSFPSAAFFPPVLGYLQIHGHISLSGRALNLALLWVPC